MNQWYDKVSALGNPNFRSVIKTFKNHAPDNSKLFPETCKSQSQGAGITLTPPSFRGRVQDDQGFAFGDGISDDFKLWLSRHPGLSIDEAIHRYRDEQKAKQRRKGPKL